MEDMVILFQASLGTPPPAQWSLSTRSRATPVTETRCCGHGWMLAPIDAASPQHADARGERDAREGRDRTSLEVAVLAGVSRTSGPAPTETPEGESSTGSGISFHDPVYRHDQWWTWVGLSAVALIAICTAGFMVARLFPV
jgi:hypothetical protein